MWLRCVGGLDVFNDCVLQIEGIQSAMYPKFSHDENANLILLHLRSHLHNVNGVKVGTNDAFSAVGRSGGSGRRQSLVVA